MADDQATGKSEKKERRQASLAVWLAITVLLLPPLYVLSCGPAFCSSNMTLLSIRTRPSTRFTSRLLCPVVTSPALAGCLDGTRTCSQSSQQWEATIDNGRSRRLQSASRSFDKSRGLARNRNGGDWLRCNRHVAIRFPPPHAAVCGHRCVCFL